MGMTVIAYAELQAWQQCAGIDLQPWEVVILRRLSADYVAESRNAEKPDCPAPYGSPDFDRDVIDKKVTQALKAFAQRK